MRIILDILGGTSYLVRRQGLEELEEGFVKFAGEYSNRKGISVAAWRDLGVPAAVLARAGIGVRKRARRQSSD
jgi:hypothetical protein